MGGRRAAYRTRRARGTASFLANSPRSTTHSRQIRFFASIGAVAGLLCDAYLASFLLTPGCDNVIKYVLAKQYSILR
jgi:hypothetical protein